MSWVGAGLWLGLVGVGLGLGSGRGFGCGWVGLGLLLGWAWVGLGMVWCWVWETKSEVNWCSYNPFERWLGGGLVAGLSTEKIMPTIGALYIYRNSSCNTM